MSDFTINSSLISKYLKYKGNLSFYSLNSLRGIRADLNETFKIYEFPSIHLQEDLGLSIPESAKATTLNTLLADLPRGLKGLSASTKERRLTTIRGFLKWLFESSLTDKDYTYKLPLTGKKNRPLPKYLSFEETETYFNSLIKDYRKSTEKFKNELIVNLLMYAAGLRVTEASSIKTKDLNLKTSQIRVFRKGNKEELVAIPKSISAQIKNLIKKNTYIYGENPLQTRTVYDWVVRRSLLYIDKKITPHGLRHSFATHMLRSGSDLRVLQELLGHKNISTTEKYTHLELSDLSDALEAHHPINK